IHDAVDRYPWDSDEEFQAGLTAIIGQNSSPELAAELTLRARVFYYSRQAESFSGIAPNTLGEKFNTAVDFDAYKAYHTHHESHFPPASASIPVTTNGIISSSTATAFATAEPSILPPPPAGVAASSEPPAPYPTSFAHIVELITTGKPIPGIKEIPNTILGGQGTEPTKPRRKKPWEKE
ncbi:hypothetical protein K432DRAFT_276640, partial [Lepidopterella palustris CBS 459.81]